MRVCTTKLIKMMIGPKAYGQNPYSSEEVKKAQDEFFNIIVPAMSHGVATSHYFCGDEITAADIVLYHELKTILILYKRQLMINEMPDLFAWYSRIARMEVIIKMDDQFIGIVKKYQFV